MRQAAGASSRSGTALLCVIAVVASGCASPGTSGGMSGRISGAEGEQYRMYVPNESSDLISRVVFDLERGARVEHEFPIGIMPRDTDGPHGIAVSPDGEFLYVTVAHGTPDGWLWKFRAGADSLVGRTALGRFPATLTTTPDGQLLVVANFNLHGDPAPSDLSIVYAPDLRELARIRTCVTPHGSRISASGRFHYSVCSHSDQVIETSLSAYAISERFSVRPGGERLLDLADDGASAVAIGTAPGCYPTWVTPGVGARADRFVYVTCNVAGQVLELDVTEWRVTRRFDTAGGPYNMAMTPDGHRLVVTLRGAQAIIILDLVSGEVLAREGTSQPFAHGVVISPDGRFAFVTNEGLGSVRGTLDVFDMEDYRRVGSVELQHQPGGIGLWTVGPVDAPDSR